MSNKCQTCTDVFHRG